MGLVNAYADTKRMKLSSPMYKSPLESTARVVASYRRADMAALPSPNGFRTCEGSILLEPAMMFKIPFVPIFMTNDALLGFESTLVKYIFPLVSLAIALGFPILLVVAKPPTAGYSTLVPAKVLTFLVTKSTLRIVLN